MWDARGLLLGQGRSHGWWLLVAAARIGLRNHVDVRSVCVGGRSAPFG